ncbi:MAG: DNA-directed RNA polymerase subunit beta' [Oscillospiraceae bacterium]|jgi:DNA-directed RNA polymerase subunit beta'|nr:DNA-directed RNA polymerase subunit beta' [Oscillospiraceae bacterium]
MSFLPFDAMQIGLASSDMIRTWSSGEVKKPETINYRTLKPERDGLFCEKIFGPSKDWECHCGKFKKIRYKGKICDRCGVEITKSNVRRERMGHIDLAAPVSHIWYFKGIPSRMGLLLDITPRVLEKVLYFATYIVIDEGDTPLKKNQILTEKEYREMREKYEDDFRAGMGAEAIRDLLEDLDIEAFSEQLKIEAKAATGQKKAKLVKRLEVVEAFRTSGNDPTWMIIETLPVIPPEIRPMVQLDGGRFATSDLNDLYRRVINRNNRLKRLIQLQAPDIIVRNEKRMLQEAVDALIDNGRRGRPVTGANSRALKSLSDMLKGKQGRFRQNLLGKRVDYSGRSVIVVGPELKLYQCGVPKEMAIELFRPFVMKKLVEDGNASNIKSAKKMVDKGITEVWDALEVVIKDHPVLLNRAPTLHRLGIQAFEPVLVEGRALMLHPLVCSAYNADFDGDQMAIHVPLSAEAQAEARILMLSANNLLHPKDGHPVTVPTHDMILGSYYLTFLREDEHGAGKFFVSPNEALMAYQCGDVNVHAPINVRISKEINGELRYKTIKTTVGRIIFNEPLPQDLGYVDRSNPENIFEYEIDFRTDKKELEKIIERCIAKHGFTRSASVLDKIKALGFKYSTQGAITISIADMTVPEAKWELIRQTEKKVIEIENHFKRGFITDDERYRLVVDEWERTTSEVTAALANTLDEFNPVKMMAASGARGSENQIRQLAGMRGLVQNTIGRTIEIPIKANFREGLTVLEYFVSSRGARKGLADTALRTADSGYLTRRLVDVSQDVIVREKDCGTHEGIIAREVYEEGKGVISTFGAVIHGRFPANDIVDEKTGELLFTRSHMLINSDSIKLLERGIDSVIVRTAMDCESSSGICAMCYGINLATGTGVSIGEAVGVIAAQSIGEPGTQLTMRTFHTGGITGDDITQGLPRVEELFEARKPKKMAILSEIDGIIDIEETRRNAIISITVTNQESGDIRSYQTPYFSGIRVKNGDAVKAGDKLTDGALNPHDIMRILGKAATQAYIISEVQIVYRQQGVDINDKHIEVIVRQMMRKVKIEDGGDTELLAGTTINSDEYKAANTTIAKRIEEGEEELRYADASPLLMGITKASLATESFLSAASFQETTKVLTEAAIKGKIDRLIGLKENVIIGKLVPAGSGLSIYRKFDSDIEYGGKSYTLTGYEGNYDDDDVDTSVLIGYGNAL